MDRFVCDGRMYLLVAACRPMGECNGRAGGHGPGNHGKNSTQQGSTIALKKKRQRDATRARQSGLTCAVAKVQMCVGSVCWQQVPIPGSSTNSLQPTMGREGASPSCLSAVSRCTRRQRDQQVRESSSGLRRVGEVSRWCCETECGNGKNHGREIACLVKWSVGLGGGKETKAVSRKVDVGRKRRNNCESCQNGVA